LRQLDQDRAARAGSDRARSGTAGRTPAAARPEHARGRQRARPQRPGAGGPAQGGRTALRHGRLPPAARGSRRAGDEDHRGKPAARARLTRRLPMSTTAATQEGNAAPRANTAAGPFRPPSVGLATLGLALASFMQVLDTTIANVSLPTISGNLGASANQATWVITSFAVSNAIA